MKKICILLSVYNGENFLKEQLDSLLSQTYKDVEILIRDDGSIDRSLEILNLYDFLILKNNGNVGIKKSFEILLSFALENSMSEYFIFCDQDDIWNKNKVETTYHKIQELENTYGKFIPLLVHSNLVVVDQNLDVLSTSFWKYQHIDPSKDSLNRLLLHNTVTGCAMMINRALAEKVKNIPKEAIMHDWWIAMVASAFGKIAYINEPLMLYRQHSANDIGAKKYGLKYISSRLFRKLNTGKFTSQVDKYVIQAQQFLAIYEHNLDNTSKKMLHDFSRLPILSKWQKIVILFKYKIWKNGFMRNLGLILFV